MSGRVGAWPRWWGDASSSRAVSNVFFFLLLCGDILLLLGRLVLVKVREAMQSNTTPYIPVYYLENQGRIV
jgi:hypothetical protein